MASASLSRFSRQASGRVILMARALTEEEKRATGKQSLLLVVSRDAELIGHRYGEISNSLFEQDDPHRWRISTYSKSAVDGVLEKSDDIILLGWRVT